jgi:hypothetical protein
MYEDGFLQFREHDVRFSGKLRRMGSVGHSLIPEHLAKDTLGLRVSRANRTHVSAALLGRKNVGHQERSRIRDMNSERLALAKTFPTDV